MQREPAWIRDDVVLAIHSRQIAEHGGMENVRDMALLESALMRPKNLYNYENPKPSVPEMAAAYAYGIAKNHPFSDGNKRTAFVVSIMFLELNGFKLNAKMEEKYRAFIALAAGNMDEKQFAGWIESNSLEY